METVSKAIHERRSIRRYKEQPVSHETVAEILAEARWAPSAGNTQSTAVYVVTGSALERVKRALREAAESEAPPSPDIQASPTWPEPCQSRMAGLFELRAAFVSAEEAKRGVQPADPPPNPMVVMAGLFGAPALLLLAMDPGVSAPYGSFDAGLLAQTIALGAHARGLGTCIMTSPMRAADALHRALPEAEGRVFVAAITLGYPDFGAAINRFPRERISQDEFVTCVS